MKEDVPLKVIKPVTDFRVLFLTYFPNSSAYMVFFTLFFLGLFFNVFSFFYYKVFDLNAVLSFIFVSLFYIFIFLILHFLVVLVAYISLKHTEYRFFSDRVEYFFGFFSVSKKVLPYSRVVNLSLRKGFFERFFDLGSIFLETPGSSTKGYELALRFVKNPEKVYDELVNIVLKKDKK